MWIRPLPHITVLTDGKPLILLCHSVLYSTDSRSHYDRLENINYTEDSIVILKHTNPVQYTNWLSYILRYIRSGYITTTSHCVITVLLYFPTEEDTVWGKLTVWGNWWLTTLQRSSCCIVHLRRIFFFFFPHEKYCLKNVPRWPLLNPCKHIRNPLKLFRRANNHYWGSDHIPSYSLQAIKTSGFLTPEIWLHACLEMRTDLLRQNPQIPLAQINLRHHTQKTTHKWEKNHLYYICM